jgi:hypothetical protein
VIERFGSHKTHLIGTSLARILVGLGGVHYYVSNYAYRAFLLGPHSYLGHMPSFGPSLYDLARTAASFEVLYHAGLVVAAVFVVFGGRGLAIAHAVLFWSAYARNPQLFDGGDTFGRIAAIFLAAAVTNAYLAPGARRRRERIPAAGSWGVIAHNGAVVLLVTQILVVYVVAGLTKLAGPAWAHGVALFQISQLADYRFVSITGVTSNPVVVGSLTYGILAVELSFPVLVWTRFRVWSVAMVAAMHTGIAVVMGLVGFAIHMCGGLAVCLRDDDYEQLARRFTRAGTRRPSRSRTPASPRPRRRRLRATPVPPP